MDLVDSSAIGAAMAMELGCFAAILVGSGGLIGTAICTLLWYFLA